MSKVKDVSVQIRGVSYKPSDLHDLLSDDSVILLRANNIEDDKLNLDDVVYVDKAKVGDTQYLRIGDILICASSGSKNLVGKATIIKENITATFGAFCKVVRPKNILPAYLGYFFISPIYRETISNLSAGANINNIRNEHIDTLEIPIPSNSIQHQIAATLDKVTHTIDLCNAMLEKLDMLVKARFVEMFGDPVTNPKGWKMVSLGDLTNVGSSKRIFEKEYVESGIPFYRTKEIVELSRGNQITTELFISEERYLDIKKQYGVPKKGDLLISAVGTIGIIWIVDGTNEFYFKDGNLIRVDGTVRFNSSYMKCLLEYLIDEYKKQMSVGTAFAALTISGLSKMKVYDVPLELQQQFATFVEQTDKTKVAVQKALEKAETLKKALMQEYFG